MQFFRGKTSLYRENSETERERERERVNNVREFVIASPQAKQSQSKFFKTAAILFCVGFLFLGFAGQTHAAAITSAQAGNWSDTATWTGGVVPGNGDTAVLAHDVAVDVNTIIGTSPSDATTLVLTINAGTTLTVNSGVELKLRGNAQKTTTGNLTLQAGATLTFDPSQAVTPTTNYLFHSTGIGTITCLGTSWAAGSFVTIQSLAGSGYGHFNTPGTDYSSSQWDCSYTKFVRLGTATTGAIATYTNTAGTKFKFHSCLFDTCVGGASLTSNPIVSCGYMSATGAFEFDKVTFTNSTGTTNLYLSGSATLTSGTRYVTNSVFDKTPYLPDPSITFDGNLPLLSTASLAAGGGASGGASVQNNLFYSPNDGGLNLNVVGSNWKNNYILSEAPGGNPHFVSEGAPGTHTVDGFIFHYNHNWASDYGDCVALGQPASATHIIVKNSIVLPGPDGKAAGTLISALGNANIDASAEHNTFATTEGMSGGVRYGETYAGHVGIITSLKSNLAWTPAGQSGGYLLNSLVSLPQDQLDLRTTLNASHNWRWNTADGNEGKGYNHLSSTGLFSSLGDPSWPTEAGTGDPQFVDSTRNILTWDATLGGPGTSAHALTELAKISNVNGDYNSAYNIVALMTYVKNGFKVRNASLNNAGADGITIGAVPYVSMDATVTSSTYTVSALSGGAGTIINVPYGTSKATFEAALAKGDTNSTWNDTGIADPVVSGNTLVVTAQDGITTGTYTITVEASQASPSPSAGSAYIPAPIEPVGTKIDTTTPTVTKTETAQTTQTPQTTQIPLPTTVAQLKAQLISLITQVIQLLTEQVIRMSK